MKSVFVDTAALIALGDKGDGFHRKALIVRDEMKESQRNFVTTNAVIFLIRQDLQDKYDFVICGRKAEIYLSFPPAIPPAIVSAAGRYITL